jgi:hypothetical protein
MRCVWSVIIALLALALSIGGAAALDAGKIAAINKAADSFVALAKDSATTGQPPRQSDANVKPLLDTVFDTAELQSGQRQPMAALDKLNEWNYAILRVGVVYILAGTGITDVTKIPNTPEIAQKINHNTAEFAPEMGRYFDAQLWIEAAVMDTVGAFVASASPAQLEQPNLKGGLAKIRAGATQTITGALTTLPLDGLSDAWRRDRLPVLSATAPIAAQFLLPEQARSLSDTASEVAGRMNDPAVKATLTSFASTLRPH